MPAVQLGIFVLDASGSMNEKIGGAPSGTTKAWQIEEMLCRPLSEALETAEDRKAALENSGVIARLQQSQRKGFIDLGIIRFDTQAMIYQEVRPVIEWELSPPSTKLQPPQSPNDPRYSLGGQPFNLMAGMGKNTNIAVGLAEANNMKNAFLKYYEQEANYEPYITLILMSDALQNEVSPNEPLNVAAQIKQTIDMSNRGRPQVLIAAAAFGDNADLNFMKQIATAPEFAVKTTDPSELRRFFLASMTQQLG